VHAVLPGSACMTPTLNRPTMLVANTITLASLRETTCSVLCGKPLPADGAALYCCSMSRGPVRLLSNVLLPTPLAGGLLGCCLVLHTTLELLHSEPNSSAATAASDSTGPAAVDAAAVSGSSSRDSGGSSSSIEGTAEAPGASKRKRQGHPWWAFWQRGTRQRLEAGDADSMAGSVAAAAAASLSLGDTAVTEADGAAAESPVGPVTPDTGVILCSSGSVEKPQDSESSAEAAALSAVSTGAFSSKSLAADSQTPAAGVRGAALEDAAASSPFEHQGKLQQQQEEQQGSLPDVSSSAGATAHPISGPSLLDFDSCDSDDGCCNENGVSGSGTLQPSGGSAGQPAAFPLSPLSSHTIAIAADGAAAADDDAPTSPTAVTPVPYQLLLRRRSSSGFGEGSGVVSVGSLSPSCSTPHSPVIQDMECQAAEVHRRWSNGQHNEMIPEAKTLKMLQQQPYRPPVFTRLSSGRGGCRITAAAAAAAAREQHAARQQQARAARSAGEGSGDAIRRYRSLDICPMGQLLSGENEAQDDSPAGAMAAAGVSEAGAAAAGAEVNNTPSAALPPLPGAGSRDLSQHVLSAQGSEAEDDLQQLLRAGVVKHRSLDWGHKLCNADTA